MNLIQLHESTEYTVCTLAKHHCLRAQCNAVTNSDQILSIKNYSIIWQVHCSYPVRLNIKFNYRKCVLNYPQKYNSGFIKRSSSLNIKWIYYSFKSTYFLKTFLIIRLYIKLQCFNVANTSDGSTNDFQNLTLIKLMECLSTVWCPPTQLRLNNINFFWKLWITK